MNENEVNSKINTHDIIVLHLEDIQAETLESAKNILQEYSVTDYTVSTHTNIYEWV